MVDLAAAGFTDKEIAKKLGVSMGSVNTYWVRCREKLGMNSRASCVAVVLGGTPATRKSNRATQLRWLALMDASSQAIMIVSHDFTVLELNARAQELFGRGASNVGTQMPVEEARVEYLDGTPMPQAEYPLIVCLETSEPVLDKSMRIFLVNGQSVCVRVNTRPLTYDSNPPSEVLMVMDVIDDPLTV